jgi:hypothetical protein
LPGEELGSGYGLPGAGDPAGGSGLLPSAPPMPLLEPIGVGETPQCQRRCDVVEQCTPRIAVVTLHEDEPPDVGVARSRKADCCRGLSYTTAHLRDGDIPIVELPDEGDDAGIEPGSESHPVDCRYPPPTGPCRLRTRTVPPLQAVEEIVALCYLLPSVPGSGGTTLPGFMIPFGSKSRLIPRMYGTRSPCSRSR